MVTNLELAKSGYKMLHDKQWRENHSDSDYFQLELSHNYTVSLLTKSEKEEYKKWRAFQRRIIENDFQELQ